MGHQFSEVLFDLLEAKYKAYNTVHFIEDDPISIPHQFTKKEDIEIAGFLAATIAWGQRKTIINNANRILGYMDHAPHDFIVNHEASDLKRIDGFVHRTFNTCDLECFFTSLKNIYKNHRGLENVFSFRSSMAETLAHFKGVFFSIPHEKRSQKHVANPLKGSTAKRLNMYLRWMVRQDHNSIDFGIWKSHEMAHLMMPLDVHTANVGRKLGLLTRKQNDWKAVEELTNSLRLYDINDPVKYDFALFGMGVNGDVEL